MQKNHVYYSFIHNSPEAKVTQAFIQTAAAYVFCGIHTDVSKKEMLTRVAQRTPEKYEII